MHSTKDQLVRKRRRSYACETQCSPVEPSGYSPLVSMKEATGRTAADSVQSGWPIVAAIARQSSRAGS
ncbi:hypothetical protein TNCV_4957581, partial [Trichonephila clavipes]